MGYCHISNLYRPEARSILLFRRCFALEKIHGTSANISWVDGHQNVFFHSGGEKHDNFVALFDKDALAESFKMMGHPEVTVFGEAYGGKQQAQSHRYGPKLRFVAFDVKVGDSWLSVPNAQQVVNRLGLEFVHFVEVDTDIETLNAQRDAPSEQAKRNGIEGDQMREGIVLRPLREFRDSNGDRIIVKHKNDIERETKTVRDASADEATLKVLAEANAIAEEWVTPTRLEHVLDKLPGACIQDTSKVIAAMIEDITREGKGEIVDSRDARRAIGTLTARFFKKRFADSLKTS
jgi:prepilin-type processing-associated H-X9-DG protein